ncbi:aminoglycoside phosphotransferase family protein [Ferrimonas balearica]|nr:aminoglycoside phosphotransferase family protein [Ferrimonas balearica]
MARPPDLLEALHADLTARHPAPPPDRWQPLAGGRSNLCWRLLGEGQDQGEDLCTEQPMGQTPRWPSGATADQPADATSDNANSDDRVLKLYRPDRSSPLFPNDAATEAACLAALAGPGPVLAPRMLDHWHGPLGPCLLYRHLPGPTWRDGPEAVARLLRQLHALPEDRQPAGLRGLETSPMALRAAIVRDLPKAPASDSPGQARLRAALAEVSDPGPLPPARQAWLHGDPVPGNIIMTPAGARLIDWQCPARGDPCHDLALFLSPAMGVLYLGRPLSKTERAAFLAAYDDRAVTDRLAGLAPLLHLRIAAHCLARAAEGSAPDARAAETELAAFDARAP